MMNTVHPHHRDEAFAELKHFVLPFHDTTFECVARGYAVETADAGGDLSGRNGELPHGGVTLRPPAIPVL